MTCLHGVFPIGVYYGLDHKQLPQNYNLLLISSFCYLATCLGIFIHGQFLLHESHLRLYGQYGNLNTKCIIIILFPIYISYSGFYSSKIYMHDMFQMISRKACTCTHTHTCCECISIERKISALVSCTFQNPGHSRTIECITKRSAHMPCRLQYHRHSTTICNQQNNGMHFTAKICAYIFQLQ